jgi:hypothetical protein
MPTPIQHLVLAQRLLDDSTLPARVRDRLQEQRGAFLFGNTAPDVQTVSHQTREATHFFVIPWAQPPVPHQAMFELHPLLGQARSLSPAHAAFIAGYICHLWLDVLWVRDIYMNGFGPRVHWGKDLREQHIYHNILRAWCDRQDQQQLDGTIGSALAAAQPIGWLPFTADQYLAQWRDVLVEQFQPESSIRTIEVFARRGGISAQEFQHLLDSPLELERHVFAHVSHAQIETFYRQGYEQMAELIVEYFHTA